MGYHSEIILSGRRVNDDMGKFIAENIVKGLIKCGRTVKDSTVSVLGFTFKENCQDTRNTKVIDIIRELEEYGVQSIVVDDVADAKEAETLYGIDIISLKDMKKSDAIVVCVQHDIFKNLTCAWFAKFFNNSQKLLFDIKGMYNKEQFSDAGYYYWRL